MTARNVGCRTLDVLDEVQGARVPVRVLYPTGAPARTERFGPYELELALDAPVDGAGRRLILVAISHGTGGTSWGYRALATRLVREGFAVLMIEHPGNTRGDNALEGTAANLANRPRHVRRALHAGVAALAPHLVPETAAVIGHSLGGYTALAVAGGRPVALPGQTPDGVAHPVPVEPDPRVRAVVLLAPALPWFMGPGALAEVRVPVLVRTGERDDLAPPGFVESVLRGLPSDTPRDGQVVPGAGHFAFFAPVPPALAGLPPALDPPGFDRTAYQPRLQADVLAFLGAHLTR